MRAPGSGLALDLVYNPLGPSLPPDQSALEATYRAQLREQFGIEFDHLATITNMPIKRFAHALERDGRHAEYMGLLVNHFNPEHGARADVPLPRVGGLGRRALRLRLQPDARAAARRARAARAAIWDDRRDLGELAGAPIATASHCFGCTAGSGSSCGGALA